MTDMQFICPHCHKSVQAENRGAGQQVQCPDCHNFAPAPSPMPVPPAPGASAVRPTSVTVFAILNIIFGGLGLLCTPIGLLSTFVMPNTLNPSPVFKAWLIFSEVAGLACSIWLLVLGIGLLKLKRWARSGSIFYGWFSIVFGIIGMIANLCALAYGGISLSPEAAFGFVGGTFGGLIGLIYPILLIVFMKRQAAVESCHG